MMQTDRRCCCEYPGFWREDWKRTAERQRQSWRQRVGDDDIWEIMVGNSQDGEGMEGVWRWGKPGGEREWDMAHTFASIGLAGAGVGNSGLGKKSGTSWTWDQSACAPNRLARGGGGGRKRRK